MRFVRERGSQGFMLMVSCYCRFILGIKYKTLIVTWRTTKTGTSAKPLSAETSLIHILRVSSGKLVVEVV